MSKKKSRLYKIMKNVETAYAPVFELQRKAEAITANIDYTSTVRAISESVGRVANAASALNASHAATAISEVARSIASFDTNYITRALSQAMHPLLANREFMTSQLDGMKSITGSVSRALDSSPIIEHTWVSIQRTYDLYTNIYRDLDLSHMSERLSHMSLLFKDVYNAWGYEYTDGDETLRIDFENDIKESVEDCKNQNWQQMLYGKFQKWKAKNPVIAAIFLFFILQFIVMFMYDTAQSRIVMSHQTAIKQLPSINAEIVVNVNQQNVFFVIDSQRYWVNVVFINPETGEIYEGWVSKRSCVELGCGEGEYEYNDYE
jgi:hypothetical protein